MRITGAVMFTIGAAIAGCGPSQIEVTPSCGDGIVDPDEACDDGNDQDGDGCSATCELEQEPEPEPGFDCVELLEAARVEALSIANAEDGSLLAAGWIRRGEAFETEARGWIGSFDAQGDQLWLREDLGASEIRGLRASGDGFLAIKQTSDNVLVRLDAQGNVEAETLILDHRPLVMVETEAGLVLAGSTPGVGFDYNYKNAWIGRLGADGEVETLLSYDHASLADEFVAIERAGDRVVALARIGVFDPSEGDIVLHDVEGTLVVELDEQGQELNRTFLMTDAGYPKDSWAGYDLTVSDDGTWIVAGQRGNPNDFGGYLEAWAVGLREGEVVWTHTIEVVEPNFDFPPAAYKAVEATDVATLVGAATGPGGKGRVIVGLEPGAGVVISEHYEPIDGGFIFTEVSSRAGDVAAFVGHSRAEDSERVWRCNVQL